MILEKTYNSLTQLKAEIERQGKEEVVDFNGWQLITKKGKKKYEYTLGLGKVKRYEL